MRGEPSIIVSAHVRASGVFAVGIHNHALEVGRRTIIVELELCRRLRIGVGGVRNRSSHILFVVVPAVVIVIVHGVVAVGVQTILHFPVVRHGIAVIIQFAVGEALVIVARIVVRVTVAVCIT